MSFDARGNAVWEWAMKPGSFKRDIDTKRLEVLAATHLEIDGGASTVWESPDRACDSADTGRPSATAMLNQYVNNQLHVVIRQV